MDRAAIFGLAQAHAWVGMQCVLAPRWQGAAAKRVLPGDATGGSGGGTAQSPIGRVATAEPDLAADPDGKDTAKEIWLDAYKTLEEDEGTKKMVLAYETLLSNQLVGSNVQLGVGADSSLCSRQTPEEKISGMRRVTEAALEKASRHSERKEGFVKAAKVINTISSAVIRPMLQNEAVASLAWAGVCVALEFSIRAATAEIDMVDGLCHVAKRMEWYMLLHALLLERPKSSTSVHETQHPKLRDRLRKSIKELYTSLLMYEIQCVCYCYRGSHITKTLRALVTLDDWKGKLNDVKELESRIQMDMLQFEQSQAADRLVKVAEDADEKFDRIQHILQHLLISREHKFSLEEKIFIQELVALFNTSDYNRQMRFNPTRVPGTCEWFCNHNTFKEWLGSDGGLLLTLYFFFKDTMEQKSLNTAICAVLHQLLLDNLVLVAKLQEAIRQAVGKKAAENSSSLCNIFSAACQGFSGGIICVFDALDECEPDDSSELIRRIKDMLQNDMKVKFLVTTRGYPQLLNQFKEFESGLIHLDGDGKQEKDAIQQEISLVLDYKLEHLSKTKNLEHQPERKAAIEKALRSKGSEQRTYLWLKLVFDIMERIPWKSDKDWAKLLISPPQNVNDAYVSFLQKVPEDERSSVKILLHLMVAAFRPLTLREMSIALNVHGSPSGDDEKSLGLQPESEFKNWVLQTCGFFITVYDDKLDFIHQTAKEFLFGSGPWMLWQQGPDRFSPVTDQTAHKTMAESSIAYLSFKCFNSRQFHERARAYPPLESVHQGWSQYAKSLHKNHGFLEYTLKYWYTHFRLCQYFDGTKFQDVGDEYVPLYISLFTSDDHCAPGWTFLHFKYVQRPLVNVRKPMDLAESYRMLDSALWFDHVRLLVHEITHNMCTNVSLFHVAAAQNAENCVQYLAVTGHDINARDESGATALCFAARNTSTKTIKRLLDYNADVNLSEEPQKRPLSYFEPCYDPEHLKLVRRLVSQGAELNDTIMATISTETAMAPLAWAAQIPYPSTSEHEDSIRGLDRWIRERLSASDLGNTANLLEHLDLFAAEEFVEAYDTSLVKFLLDHGADINGVDPSWSSGGHGLRRPMTALEHACHCAPNAPGDEVFWNAVFLMHGGANSRLNIESGNAALDWLIRSPPTSELMKRHHNTNHLALDGWECWDALAMLLLKQNPASNYINNPILSNTMQTRLHTLSASHDVSFRQEKVRLLLRHGAGVNCQDVHGKTPMHYLSFHTSVETEVCAVIEMLIENGADFEMRDSLGRTPMHYVRSPMVLDMLAKNGASIEARDSQGNTPLQAILACRGAEARRDIVRSLIAFGADTTVRNCTGETLLHTAATSDFADKFSPLFQAGIDLDVTNKRGETPLQVALNHRCHAAAAWLLGGGASAKPLQQRIFDTEQPDLRTGATLLVFASEAHAHGAVRILLRRGANPNALATVEESDIERYLDRLDCIRNGKEWFFKHERLRTRTRKSKVSKPDQHWHHIKLSHRNGRPLHLAMGNGWTRNAEITVDLLLRHGADIEARSGLGQTPLQVACHYGNELGVRLLLKHGAHAYVHEARSRAEVATGLDAPKHKKEIMAGYKTN
ncbi:hypothetical protein LA080_014318 [Diaporthe eres]|nr:hypothetical protein LA080_014318 [Diaporthe eres]